jgi:hypothetical protein
MLPAPDSGNLWNPSIDFPQALLKMESIQPRHTNDLVPHKTNVIGALLVGYNEKDIRV